MPLPLVPLIGAGASILGNVLNNNAVSSANQQNQQFQERMYGLQRAASLSDWHMQNQYNSPQAQMQRYKDAGLNPNLIYGQSNTAAPVRSTESPRMQFQPKQYDLASIIPMMYDLIKTQAQTNNLEAQSKLAAQATAVKAAQEAGQLVLNRRNEVGVNADQLKLDIARNLAPVTLEMERGKLHNLLARTNFVINEDERKGFLAQNTLAKGVEEILKIRADKAKSEAERERILASIPLLKESTEFKRMENAFLRKGISLHDPYAVRTGSLIADQLTKSIDYVQKHGLGQPFLQGIKSSFGAWLGF